MADTQTQINELYRLVRRLQTRLGPLELAEIPDATTVTSWTPAFAGSTAAGSYTYVAQIGNYVRLGGLVYFDGRCAISAITSAPTGSMKITGLPIAASATTPSAGMAWSSISNFNFSAGALMLVGQISAGTSDILLLEAFDNLVGANVSGANFTNANCSLVFSGWYRI